MRLIHLIAALSPLFSSLIASGQPPDRSNPNVVLIVSDDLGWCDLGCYGCTDIKTPHIDSLARAGVRFTDFYSNGVLCTPTRAGLISGRYQQRFGIEAAIPSEFAPGGDRGLPANGRSLPQLLKNHGYRTALIGKWHLGYQATSSPAAHGFDYFFGLKSGYHDYYTHRGSDGRLDLWENDQLVEVPGYTTDLITQKSTRFIKENARRPFFLEAAYTAPHWPYQPPDKPSVAPLNSRHLMPGDPITCTRADYAAMVQRLDEGVGEILKTLEQTGIADNTIVIFTNDNGGEWLSNNGPLFHRKWTVWEGGIRVPTIIRWPGRIPAGQVSRQVGISMDLTASILAETGAPVPAGTRLEGINLVPILAGRSPVMERTLFWRASAGFRLQRAVRSGDWKLVIDDDQEFVFDLSTDLGERQDLANRRQDVAQKLRAMLVSWDRSVNADAREFLKASPVP